MIRRAHTAVKYFTYGRAIGNLNFRKPFMFFQNELNVCTFFIRSETYFGCFTCVCVTDITTYCLVNIQTKVISMVVTP